MGIIFFLIWKQLKIFTSYRFFKISAPNAIIPTNKLYVKIYNRSKSMAAVNVKVWWARSTSRWSAKFSKAKYKQYKDVRNMGLKWV